MCHGPGSQHASTFDKNKIAINAKANACASCHDEPWRHNKYAQYENSVHADAIFETGFARAGDNSMGFCARCHDGQGFIDFTKGELLDATTLTAASHVAITCATCHDPHGNSNNFSLRSTPVGTDTLGNGYSYTNVGGEGQVCMNCHKARRDVVSYVAGGVNSSHWGPHHSTQSDVLLGKNAASFGSAYVSGTHQFALTNLCVDCHMVATTDTGTVTRDRVGGHSWKLYDADNNYYHTTGCATCHGPKTSWEDFKATADYDGNGATESITKEINGLLTRLATALPPVGDPSIDWSILDSLKDLNLNKAYWNYQLIANDGSKGMHNSKFAIDVLVKTLQAIGAVVPVELTSFEANANDNVVNLKWQTATETNNKGFQVERNVLNTWRSIGFVDGKGTTTEINNYSFVDNLEGVSASGKISYRLKQVDLDGTSKYSKEVEVTFNNGPKEYTLAQNYPNPFNPSTTIDYSLPFESNVKVVIYNVTGEVVKVLVNNVQVAGHHKANFNTESTGRSLSSGIYFYSIEASSIDGKNNFKQTKKMILMK
jgi:hypothetical protein